jgi:hypothetical protein
MTTFNCDLVNKRVRADTVCDGSHQTFIASVTIPAGTQIAQNDIINIMDLMTKHVVTAIRVYTDDLDDGTTMAWDVGFAQLVPGTGYGGVNASGVAQDFLVAEGAFYTSPATSAAFYATGATFGRAAGFSSLTLTAGAIAANTGNAGPVRLTATQTASTPTQTTADDVDRVIRFEFDVVRATPAPQPNVFVNMGGY